MKKNNLQSYFTSVKKVCLSCINYIFKSINIDQLLLLAQRNRSQHNINRSLVLLRFTELAYKEKSNVDTSTFDRLALTCVIELIKI